MVVIDASVETSEARNSERLGGGCLAACISNRCSALVYCDVFSLYEFPPHAPRQFIYAFIVHMFFAFTLPETVWRFMWTSGDSCGGASSPARFATEKRTIPHDTIPYRWSLHDGE